MVWLADFCSKAQNQFSIHYRIMIDTIDPPTGSRIESRLSKQIWDVYQENKQTSTQYLNKLYLWKQLNSLIKTQFSDYGLFMAGSTLNGFGLKASDVDFSFLSETSVFDKYIAEYKLKLLLNHLKTREFIKSSKLIPALVPLINFYYDDISVDINYNSTVNIRNTHLLYCYSQVDWRVRPIVMVIKLWAKHHNIIDAKNGSLSSYPFILMIIHYLQCGVKPAVLPSLQNIFKDKFDNSDIRNINFFEKFSIPKTAFKSTNNESLEELLIGFFRYYADFEFNNYVISIRKGTKLFSLNYSIDHFGKSNYDAYALKFINIEEPFSLFNVGRTLHKETMYHHIKDLFKISYRKIVLNRNLSEIF